MEKKISLTGVKPTGAPHIGNYLGAIKPALELTKNYEARYFIADYHALNTVKDPQILSSLIYDVAAVWLACGLDPGKVLFYRQSAVPETFTLSTMLMAFTSKGLMNRAHAYKSASTINIEVGKDPDFGINMGLFTYPVLMAADILLFDPDVVPVGKDQKQHLEMTIDIAQMVNRTYKKELFNIPEAVINEDTKTVIGMDGRKMSKSYNNTIPMFLPPKKLKKKIMKIVTTSQSIEEPKEPDTCNVFAIYKLFANEAQKIEMRKRYTKGGMGWGDAKHALFELLDSVVEPMRKRYEELKDDKEYLDKVLREGAEKARSIAETKIKFLQKEIGLQ